MDKIVVADSYKNIDIISEPFINEKGRRYVTVKGKCPRCGGTGFFTVGVCYKCNGTRYIKKDVRAYTEEEYTRLQTAKARSRQRKEEMQKAKEQELIDNAAAYKHEVALKLGFGENEKAYLVYGDDTFLIKNKLKEMGARFDPTLKWYFSEAVELPEGYKLCVMSFDELYDYNPKAKWAQFKENAKEIVGRRIAELNGPSTSIYYPAAEKERIRNITAKVSKIKGFEGLYGYTYVYTFTSGDYVFIWMTSKSDLNLSIGDVIDLTGTIKKFDEYLGVKQTHLNRCKINKIGD